MTRYSKQERKAGMEYIRKEISTSLDSLMKGLFKDEQHDLLDQIISDLECRMDSLKEETEEL